MKISKSDALAANSSRPTLRFEEQDLTSFAGLVLFQSLFARLSLYRRLAGCFRHRRVSPIFPTAKIILLLIVHQLLGFRCLRESRFYDDDPMVLRVLGLRRLPDVSTISRQLSGLDLASVEKLEGLRAELVLERVAALPCKRITLDFDGSVIGTGRRAEGVAVGYNKLKKGQRAVTGHSSTSIDALISIGFAPFPGGHRYRRSARARQPVGIRAADGPAFELTGAVAVAGRYPGRASAERIGSSAKHVFHTRGVSAITSWAGCSPTRCSTSTR